MYSSIQKGTIVEFRVLKYGNYSAPRLGTIESCNDYEFPYPVYVITDIHNGNQYCRMLDEISTVPYVLQAIEELMDI